MCDDRGWIAFQDTQKCYRNWRSTGAIFGVADSGYDLSTIRSLKPDERKPLHELPLPYAKVYK